MPSDRTFVTEVATGLGMLGDPDVGAAVAARSPVLATLAAADWDRLGSLWHAGDYAAEFAASVANGRAFLDAADALNGRRPRVIEWTGGRRPPGDEVVPADLRVDHVYLVSCKYLSRILHNPSPARLVEGLLAHAPVDDQRDWYQRVAPDAYQELYRRCAEAWAPGFPDRASDLRPEQRRRLAQALRGGWPDGAADAYAALCATVSAATATEWRRHVHRRNAEELLWRLLRIGSAPYFILGTSTRGSTRIRIGTPWDWRQAFRLQGFEAFAQPGGQPRVGWVARYRARQGPGGGTVAGHVEIRWSHGRFGQPPEAKVYLDTPFEEVPGYHAL